MQVKAQRVTLSKALKKSTSDRTESNREVSLQEVDEFPHFDQIAHGDLLSLSLSTNTSSFTHSLHRFPAKYIPQVPRWAITNFTTDKSIVLDPFMGSGTTLVEALCKVKKSYGTDIDPLAQLIAQAKTANYNLTRLKEFSAKLVPAKLPKINQCKLPMQGVNNITHWFTEQAWNDLCRIEKGIQLLECTDEERSFFITVFSSILRWVSNADDQTQKTYVSGTLIKTPPKVFPTFEKFLNRSLIGVESLQMVRGKRQSEILSGNALSVPLRNNSVDLIVTSPPYLDSVDYMYNFMLEYFWLGPRLGVETRSEYNAKRRVPIGAKNPALLTSSLPSSITHLVDMEQIPEYRRDAVIAYFDLMHKHFVEASRILKDGARYVLVVGNSQASSGVIPVHDCLLRLAKTAGLHLEKAFAYRIRRHYMKFPRKGRGGIILMDWVITLQKSTHALMDSENNLPIPKVTIGADEVAN